MQVIVVKTSPTLSDYQRFPNETLLEALNMFKDKIKIYGS